MGSRTVGVLSPALDSGRYWMPLLGPRSYVQRQWYALLLVSACSGIPADSIVVPPDTVLPPPTDTIPPPVGTAPRFGDDSADRLIWRDDFEGYASTAALLTGAWDRGPDLNAVLDLLGGRNGGRGVRFDLQAISQGPYLRRGGLNQGQSRTFFSWWFRLPPGDDPRGGKHVIIHHSAEGQPGCSGTLLRYQFPWGPVNDFRDELGGRNSAHGRINGEPEVDRACNGPDNHGLPSAVWSKEADPTDPRMPVVAADPAIGLTPWGPQNDGQWHEFTIELSRGTYPQGYVRLWIDRYLGWDSSPKRMNHPGIPTTFEWAWVSGGPKQAATIFVDDIVVWRR